LRSFSIQYVTILLLISVILLIIGIVVVVQSGNATQYMIQAWGSAPPGLIMTVQNAFTCCGLSAFNQSSYWPCPANASTPGSPPCLPLLNNAFQSAYSQAGGAGIAFSVFMVISIVFVFVLIKGIKKKNYEMSLESIRHKQEEDMQKNLEQDDAQNYDFEYENQFGTDDNNGQTTSAQTNAQSYDHGNNDDQSNGVKPKRRAHKYQDIEYGEESSEASMFDKQGYNPDVNKSQKKK
jgi:hypothetical protein